MPPQEWQAYAEDIGLTDKQLDGLIDMLDDQELWHQSPEMEQFFKVVDKEKTEVRWQSEWYDQFTLSNVIQLASKFTMLS
jgi:tyrosyl-tRNA synthetase